ncbi:hypothetical protein CR513_37355, partial [Mucuna pruriens]
MDRNMVDAASGGALMDKTPVTATVRESTNGATVPCEVARRRDHARSESSQLSTVGFEIPGTNVSPATATANATTRKFFCNGGLAFTISTKYDCHNTKFKNLGGTAGRHYKSNAVSQFRKYTFVDDSESARERSQHCTTTISIPLPFLNRKSQLRFEIDEDLLKLFRKVVINIPLLHTIKQAKFLKELCIHKRKKIKGAAETGVIMLALVKHEDASARFQQIFPKKCQDSGIFVIPCTIDNRMFTDAMLDLGASINVMPESIYKSLNIRDLEPTGMEIQLPNKSVVQPLGILKDILIQVNELIFLAYFYVLDMEDEASREGSTLILG